MKVESFYSNNTYCDRVLTKFVCILSVKLFKAPSAKYIQCIFEIDLFIGVVFYCFLRPSLKCGCYFSLHSGNWVTGLID
jgi:hypothetical protein